MNEVRITPSILNADLNNLESEIKKIAAVSDLLHLDIMDNKFVPNQTWNFEAAEKIIRSAPLPVDAHLMIEDPDTQAVKYAEVGCKSVTIHFEASSNVRQTLQTIRRAGARAAIALKPKTDFSVLLEYRELIDMILIMTVEPGFGGQKFMSDMMDKVKKSRDFIGDADIWLQVDGGISLDTIEVAREAGADTFVAGSAVFKAPNPAEMVLQLKELATK
ncbi:MAG: ribulose-phosphate 3-epimerase [Actinomycetales bacterium]|jgi:ribulose-phosphate 3-epimerase|nr:ribulose-phosphate 3-epimerase [Actinomycetales bacterium]